MYAAYGDVPRVLCWHASRLRLTRPYRARRVFPALQYLSSSKIAIAVAGNFAFATALVLYKLLVKVSAWHPTAQTLAAWATLTPLPT